MKLTIDQTECILQNRQIIPCSLTDTQCFCTSPELIGIITPCVDSTCTSHEALQYAKSQMLLCSPDAHDTNKKLSITNWTSFAMVTLAVTLRILARGTGGTTIGLWWDDALIFVSFGLDVGCSAVQQVMQSKYGFGSEAWGLTPTQITQFARVMSLSSERSLSNC